MYAEERQREILTRARLEGRGDVTRLAEEFGVTTETIRRDLTVLERQGLVKRVHGGAIPMSRVGFEPAVAARDQVMTAEKERIAKAALEELPGEGSILIDAGTTTARLAEALPADLPFTVVTNGVPLAHSLAMRPSLTVILIGGRVRGRTLATVDVSALGMLRDLFVDVAFIATNGISMERGLTTADPAEAAVKRAMLAAGRRRVLLADHTKIGDDHFARFGDLSDVDVLISDTGLDRAVAAQLEAAGPKVVLA